jgi:hypothetical protein
VGNPPLAPGTPLSAPAPAPGSRLAPASGTPLQPGLFATILARLLY